MAKLIYSMITSLDGYAEAAEGDLGTGAEDQEVHTFIGDVFRHVGTYLYGRRMYETMVFWETAHTVPDAPPHIVQYARDWQAAEKVVYSTTLESVSSAKTRIERTFDPDAVRRLKAEADHDLSRRRPEPRRPGDRGRPGGRVPPLHHDERGRRRQAVLPRRRAPRSRAGRGACLRQRTDLRALPDPLSRTGGRRSPGHDEGPGSPSGEPGPSAGGRYWDRTSDLFGVNEALYH